MPEKASQKFGPERKMALGPTFKLYEIDPLRASEAGLPVQADQD